MIKNVLVFLFALGALNSSALDPLTEQAKVSLITCSEGDELYSVFGHSAIRIVEPNAFDIVYNYGTFEFSDDFYLLFAQGKLNYKLSRTGFEYFNYEYVVSGRGVKEQVLDLTLDQKQGVFDFLEHNYLKENREYLYDFFYDNCATRIRDLFKEVLGASLEFHSNFTPEAVTYRDLIDQKLAPMDWSDFGIDIALGIPCDAPVVAEQNMFLPDGVYAEFAAATIDGRPFVLAEEELLPMELKIENPMVDWALMLCLFFVVLALIHVFVISRNGRTSQLIPGLLFTVSSLIGIGVFLLWFATDHVTTKWNMNLIWAFPLHIFVFAVARKNPNKTKNYFRFVFIALVFFVLVGWTFKQSFHPGFFLIALALAIVSYKYTGFGKKHLNLYSK